MLFNSNNPFNELIDDLHVPTTSTRNRSSTVGSATSDISLIDELDIMDNKFAPLTPKVLIPFPSVGNIDKIITEVDEEMEEDILTPMSSVSPSRMSTSTSGLSLANSASLTSNSPASPISNSTLSLLKSTNSTATTLSKSTSFIPNSSPPTFNISGTNSKNLNFSSTPINEYSNDSDESSLLANSRASTPPTPFASSLDLKRISINHSHSNQLEYLELIEPSAIKPPHYNTLPPGGCPKYAIFDTPHGNEPLPGYSPSTYKICLASRKVEWLSPYEPSPQRSWKPIIVELNSTQLNLYSIPQNLEQSVQNFKPDHKLTQFEIDDLSDLNSQFTTPEEFQLLKFCQRLGCINDSKKKLLRSYSLQHAKIGLASDYKKKPYVLRLRIESEQILLSFTTINDLIQLNLGLTIGRDLSLDLNERECPRYRTVPRRRRNRRAHSDPYVSTCTTSASRLRAHSESSKLIGTITKFRSKFKQEKPILKGNPNAESRAPQLPVVVPEDDLDNTEDYQEDVELSDLREDDEEEDEEDAFLPGREESSTSVAHPTFSAPTAEYSKWNPGTEKQSEYKFYKNCLRCIKPLTSEDVWVSRSVVKPTPLSPLNLAYLSKINYASSNSTISNLSLNSKSSSMSGSTRARSKSGSRDGSGLSLSLSDSMLTKVPDHFLKEYIVGAHGLIPQDLQVS